MDKKKEIYKKPTVEIKLIAVEDGFETSGHIEGFEYDGTITW